MPTRLIRYTAKPDLVDDNAALIAAVFRKLHETQPAGIGYLVLRLADGEFVHLVSAQGDTSALTQLDAFQAFQRGTDERFEARPSTRDVTVIGRYGDIG
jgi:hypothetical protein